MVYFIVDFHRKSIRLKNYDYADGGCYFVTIDIQDKLGLFWDKNGINEIGKMIENCWIDLIDRFQIELDEYVIMPDHFHGIVVILWHRAAIKAARTLDPLNTKIVGAGFMPALDWNQNGHNLGEIIGAFKSISTGKYIDGVKNNNWPEFHGKLWQRDYYERIIRDKEELNRIRKYVVENPEKL